MGRQQLALSALGLLAAFGLGVGSGWWLRGAPVAASTPPRSPAVEMGESSASEPERPVLETRREDGADGARTPAVEESAAPEPRGRFELSVSVTDRKGKPLCDATVRVVSADGARDARWENDSFLFDGLAAGEHVVTASLREFYPARRTVTLAGSPRRVLERIELEPHQRIAVHVTVPSGEPYVLPPGRGASEAPEVAVALRQPPAIHKLFVQVTEEPYPPMHVLETSVPRTRSRLERDPLARIRGAATAAIGHVVLERPAPLYLCLLQGPIHLESRLVQPGDDEVTFVVDPGRLAALVGELRLRLVDDATDEPVTASVSLNGENWGATQAAGPDGTFVYAPLFAEDLQLLVRSLDHAPYDAAFHLPPGEHLDLGTLRLVPVPRIRGRVVDDVGRGVPDAKLRYGPTGNEDDWRTTSTSADGGFELGGMAPGRILVTGRTTTGDLRGGRRGSGAGNSERTVLRTPAVVLDTREDWPEELTLVASAPTEIELVPREGSARRRYRVLDALGTTIEEGTVRSEPVPLWLLQGDYELILTDGQDLEQRVALTVGPRWSQVDLP